MVVSGIEIALDIEAYLRNKTKGTRLVGEHVMACCPFHDDRNPSFGAHRRTGAYNCFGCGAKGSIQQLIQALEGFSSVYDAEQYLIAKYGRFQAFQALEPDLPLEIDIDSPIVREIVPNVIDDSTLQPYRYRHPYLTKRGISERIQRTFEIGYSQSKRAITIPWRDEAGRLITVKFRSVRDKRFWYEPRVESGVKAQLWYGLNRALRQRHKRIAVVEAEIDCLSVWDVGTACIAIGGNQPSKAQFAKLVRCLDEGTDIVVFTDNDQGGEYAKERLASELAGRFALRAVEWGTTPVKDANEATIEQRKALLDDAIPLGIAIEI